MLGNWREDPIIPGSMGSGSSVARGGKIYAIGDKNLRKEERMEWKREVGGKEVRVVVEGTGWLGQVYDGEKWDFIR